jgi:hypothetical protein
MVTNLDDLIYEKFQEEELQSDIFDKKIEDEISNRKDEFYKKVSYLFLNLSQTNIALSYENNLNKSIKNDLWEYGVLIIWKTIILFCYEKMFQIFTLGLLNQKFIDNLKSHNRDCINCFSFNCLEDKFIGDNLHYIWKNLDKNFQNIFKDLLNERNSLSHVNEYEYSEVKFMAYFEKSLELLDYLEKLHLMNIDEIVNFIIKNNYFPNLCEKEIKKLLVLSERNNQILVFLISLIPKKIINDDIIDRLKKIAIDKFTNSSSFYDAYFNGLNFIIPILPFLNKEDFLSILNLTFDNQKKYPINQIIHANKIDEIFINLYNKSFNNEPEILNDWKIFINKVTELKANKNLSELIKLIKENN